MKNLCLFLSLLLLVGTGLFAQNVSLDQALQSSTKTIETQLPHGTQLAVLAFTASTQEFSDYILDELAIAIAVSNKITVIDRQYTDVIRKEMNIQMSGEVSDDEIRRIGIQLGAQYIVTGSIVDVGNAYRFRVVAINVETAVREASVSLSINHNDPQAVFLLTGQGAQPVVYRIGNFGPAGGIIFYDKGVFSNGWRYLEAAPVEIEFMATWGVSWEGHYGDELFNLFYVDGTMVEVGFGKRNTQLIMEHLNQKGESGRAAQLCVSLNFDGFNDWFLPSKDELDLMYKNLKQKGLGSFGGNLYWSSSQLGIDDYVWYQNFDDGSQSGFLKNHFNSVRAIRAF
jgi:TolB-like protein